MTFTNSEVNTLAYAVARALSENYDTSCEIQQELLEALEALEVKLSQ